jgi:hypothetical protein
LSSLEIKFFHLIATPRWVKIRLQSFFRFMLALHPEKCPFYPLVLKYVALQNLLGCDEFMTDEVTGGWRKLHNEELHNLYSFPSII